MGLTTIRYYTTLKQQAAANMSDMRLTTIRYYTTLKRLFAAVLCHIV